MQHKWHFFDESERRRWQDPEAILKSIGLKQDMTFVDCGCGEGFFTIPAARIVGKTGKVYGVDIDNEAIESIKLKAKTADLDNIILKVGQAEQTVFCNACADIVFFGIVLHDFADPAKVLLNARHMLRPNGRLVNLDWKKTVSPFGPPLSRRFSEDTAANLIQMAGFRVVSAEDSGEYNYIITATKEDGG